MNIRGLQQSSVKTPQRATIRSALRGIPAAPSITRVKSIFFIQTMDLDQAQNLIDLMRLHTDEIMFNSHWNDETYVYDWDAHPAWNYSNGFRDNSFPAINGVQGGADGRGISGYGTLGFLGADPQRLAVYLSWILYPRAAFNVQNYRCGTTRNLVPTQYWSSASLMSVISGGGGAYPYDGPDSFDSTVLTTPPPADIDGVAAGTYEAVPLPDFAGVFTLHGAQFMREMIFPFPNIQNVNPV